MLSDLNIHSFTRYSTFQFVEIELVFSLPRSKRMPVAYLNYSKSS